MESTNRHKPLSELDKCIRFLIANGWELEEYCAKEEFRSYSKECHYGIDISDGEIVFIDDTGDFLHLPINYYSLVGVLVHYRQISFNFKQYSDYKVKIVNRIPKQDKNERIKI